MARARSGRRGGEYGEFWPGYVDVLSTLLLVFIFLLSIFMLAQYFVSQESSGKDNALRRLNQQIAELTNLLSLAKGQSKEAQDQIAALTATLTTLQAENRRLTGLSSGTETKLSDATSRAQSLESELDKQKQVSNEALARVDLLNQQLLALRRQIAALNEALDASEKRDQDSQVRIKDLGSRLNAALARQVQELQRYRSDFFGRLRDLLKGRKDIRVVGDRFIFQSEVLFPSGSADMSVEGLVAMDELAKAIVELQKNIPNEIQWVLQVDGH
ncbi:MAG: peptidoglycan-binding protein, partial [Alphaproteobacteria bacterium]|nr:peptidoglycan-binding protein [Alphaproteobacteria bacterium]